MKKNSRGFTLMETLIVSTFVIGTLVYLFVQFSNIKKTYDVSFKRDTISGIYYTKNIISYLEKIDIKDITNVLETKTYVEIENCSFTVSFENYCTELMTLAGVKKAIVTKDDLTDLKTELKSSTTNPFSEGMYQYILSMSTPKIEKNRVIIEFNDGTFASLQMK